ncbi:helix-turn-helix domain-containing protein [Delftia tsuruhatensis]|uniref:helix-turn-helix domain-containing protein n=1 Tax=Delftia tsuruhatensis TaxID=180282 RepID=UPI003A8A3461
MANTFGARLVLARTEKGLGQMTLAERAGMAQTQLSRYETDKVRPRLRIINSLAAALSVDPDWLLNGDDDADVEPVETAPTTQCKLRIPVDLYAGLSKLAGAANRSLNAEIVHRLAQTLGEDFAAEQPAAQPVLAELLVQMREQTGLLRELVELARDAANPD